MHLSKVKKGTLIWITGMAGAGKTTIANQLTLELKKNNYQCIHLDGDSLRRSVTGLLDNSLSYNIDNRKKLSQTYFKLCKILTNQEFVVIISSISMYKEIYEWNKKNFKSYYLIYLNFSKVCFFVWKK